MFAMLEPGGAWVHVNATTHQGVPTNEPLPAPAPPRDEITVHRYLGEVRRAGQDQSLTLKAVYVKLCDSARAQPGDDGASISSTGPPLTDRVSGLWIKEVQ